MHDRNINVGKLSVFNRHKKAPQRLKKDEVQEYEEK
jgi:hypothetical protein